MNRTIKISLTILILAVGFVGVRVYFILSSQFDVAIAQPTPVARNYQESDDFDSDGLSNQDEAFWTTDPYNPDTDGDGFLDGEEVLSGHDPLNSQEGDLLTKNSISQGNLTQNIASLIVSGIAAGDLSNQASDLTFNKSVDDLTLSAIVDTIGVLGNSRVQNLDHQITSSSPADQQAYLNKLNDVLRDNLANVITGQPQVVNRLFSAIGSNGFTSEDTAAIRGTFLGYALAFEGAYNQLLGIPVPQNWLALQEKSLDLIKRAEIHHRSIALSGNDPFKMLIAFSSLQGLYLDSQPLFSQIAEKIKAENLKNPNEELFQTLNGF
ncbi:MAG: hypothetical protein COV31_01510 [Candidatus Yanofskybacteria bacterium CG10_big_fil_rev_8_21_14_0_10_46_23]|uniref:EF-hand domain-containing protein n=1 Tax=Candidatus Yanofskybacteria bacterium CG10_big_fil_rev_8_21_14_0_10_46_23 TaxID=1975098 RepID=A0A2H0R4V6_9BACT|nr:MAG: hypothetical protein COV31_01510 [Candidatus Yanofskybacteria bacterium CG10_big_fil_rev_8_21_14_0_10_46_23]